MAMNNAAILIFLYIRNYIYKNKQGNRIPVPNTDTLSYYRTSKIIEV